MPQFPLVISFYTKNTLYQLEVQNLIASCEKFGVKADIDGIDSFGSWELNCAYKPFFIYQKLQEYKKPLIWLDADAVFAQKPSIIPAFEADFSLRINHELPADHPSKVNSGTLYINYTKPAILLLQAWIGQTKKHLLTKQPGVEFWDQISLRDALQDQQQTAKIAPLPLAYAKIFDHKQDLLDAPNPVIEHYQASRRLKSLITNKLDL